MVRSSAEVTVACTALDDEGRGIGHDGGLTLHVAGLLPGERGRVRVAHVSPHAPRAWAELVALDGAPSDERVPPACPNHGRCGGCSLQHLAYPAQLSFKRRLVEAELAAFPSLREVPVLDPVASPRELHYRNKAKYVLGARPGGEVYLGSYEPASHDLIDMSGCQVPQEPIDQVARLVARALRGLAPVYDERSRAGELRYLVVRADPDGALLVVVVTRTRAPRPALGKLARELRASQPAVVGVLHNVNPATSGRILGDEEAVLDGGATLEDQVGDIPLALGGRSFFQVNRGTAARLYAAVCDAAGARPGVRAVDLYSGVGGIALALARRGARVVGVEAVAAAVDDARRTAEQMSLGARFIVEDAARGLPQAARMLGGMDVLVVDPPRKGLSKEARAAVAQAKPRRLVYVSCNPRTMAADLAALPFKVISVQPYDMMPGTPQIEALAVATGRT